MSLYLTYDINYHSDGFGAQYHRLVGIYCLAKLIDAKYAHTPIIRFEHLPENYSEKINQHFGLNKFELGQNGVPEVFQETISNTIPNTLDSLKIDTQGENKLIKIGMPHHILDNNPDLFDVGMNELRELKKKINLPEFVNNKTNIAIHIRRGDVGTESNSDRYTDNNYYVNIINKLNEKYKGCNIFIFSQGTEGFDEFKQIQNVKILNDFDVIETFEYLCNADVLIMAKSSLSYLAALYSNSSDIYMEPFTHWPHKKLNRWKSMNDLMDNKVEGYENLNNNNNNNNILFILLALIFLFVLYFIKIIIKKIRLFYSSLLYKSSSKGKTKRK